MDDRKALLIGCGVGLILMVCVGAVVLFAAGIMVFNQVTENFVEEVELPPVEPEVEDIIESVSDDLFGLGDETLQTLKDVLVPENNPVDIAERLLGLENIPDTYLDTNAPYQVGDSQQFWLTDTDTDENYQMTAELQYITDHAYFWIEEGVSYNENALATLVETFEDHIYPTTREFFGSEWSPGIDGDEHIYILYARGIGGNVAGYFSSADEIHPDAHEFSNAHEMFVINAGNTSISGNYIYDVLTHEFQHMIHWNQDRNESSWMNEGFAEVATLIAGYSSSGADFLYLSDPDLQLNDWPNDSSATGPHYGAAYLFLAYFLDRLGEEATQALVAHPENGLESIDLVLEDLDVHDPLRDAPLRADDLVLDWTITNYLMDDNVADGRFVYIKNEGAQKTYRSESIEDCSEGSLQRVVRQYGVDYFSFECTGEYTLRFEGLENTTLLPEDAYSGDYSFWSNKGDESDITLTHTFDFTDHTGDLTFSYWTWYDIETDWDYLYLLASMDGGETWEFIFTPSGTDTNPTGNSYGWGYTGLSGNRFESEWIQESVDISQFAGQEVMLRFEYITDAAVNGEGLLLDDVSIPEIDYFTDFEEDDGGWVNAGFVRVANILPQTFELALIIYGDTIEVNYLTLDESNTLETNLSIGGDVDRVVLVVVGTTRFTRQPAVYTLSFGP